MTIRLQHCLAAGVLLAAPAFAACDGPDEGEAATVVTVPANRSVDVFHYRAGATASIAEFCIREAGGEWKIMASHGSDYGTWSLLQPWFSPRTVEIKTRAYANGTLAPFKSATRAKTPYGFSFLWLDGAPGETNDQIVYCYKGAPGCPTSRRLEFP